LFFNDGRYVKKLSKKSTRSEHQAVSAIAGLRWINNGASILPSLKKVILGEAQNYPRSIPGRIS